MELFEITLDKKALADYLYNARTTADVSGAEMALHLQCHQPQIANIEAGNHQPRLENLVKYLNKIGLRLVILKE